jgi:hypothetical protein
VKYMEDILAIAQEKLRAWAHNYRRISRPIESVWASEFHAQGLGRFQDFWERRSERRAE